jgi:acyl dehydratase
MKPLYYEDYVEGMSFRTIRRTITDYDVSNFVAMAGMYGPMFMDHDYAKGHYGGRLVPGSLVLSLSDGLILQTGVLEDRGLALMQMVVKYRRPVVEGDSIYVEVSLDNKRLASRGSRGIVTTSHSIRKQDDEEVVEALVTRMVKTEAYDNPRSGDE